jgi:hypothetical protein
MNASNENVIYLPAAGIKRRVRGRFTRQFRFAAGQIDA